VLAQIGTAILGYRFGDDWLHVIDRDATRAELVVGTGTCLQSS
jgi:hypothetical protein